MDVPVRIRAYGALPSEEEAARILRGSSYGLIDRPHNWPSVGEVRFDSLYLRYRPELPDVLKKLDLTLPGGSRIGVIGRTGAGKSSLLTALFRLVEARQGTILIDGVSIHSISIATLRESISIIPQDPVLFSGNLLQNLDPLGTRLRSDRGFDCGCLLPAVCAF